MRSLGGQITTGIVWWTCRTLSQEYVNMLMVIRVHRQKGGLQLYNALSSHAFKDELRKALDDSST